MTALGPLPPTLGPRRTFALVAGVERYEISHRWNLRGPARDALRFARWLTGPGEVPAANVRLLLSPLDDPDTLDWSASPGLAALRSTYRPATEANAKAALLDELPEHDGDLLWIFWAGHGYLGRDGELMLPCADARPGQIRHLNLDSALRWWRTDLVKHRRFPLQAALVDACRVDAPRGSRWNFGSADYGGGRTVPGRRQFRLYASREGEAAQNDAERGAGRFTEALLGELGDRSVEEGATRLLHAARNIHRAFRELRERGEGWQLPQFLVDRDWDANSFLDDDLPGPVLPHAPRLDQTGWDGLGELFEGRDLPRCAYEAYAWAFKAAGCTTPVHGGLPADTLLDVVADLDERQGGRTGMPLAVPFVHYLADRTARPGGGPGGGPADPAWAARLAQWVRATRERLGLPALRPPPAPARQTALHVRLESPPGGEDGLLARMWLRGERTRHVWESEGSPVTLAAVRAELVRRLAQGDPGAGQPYGSVGRIEFHVPYELLETDFDQWPVPRGPGGRTRPLGMVYEVVVRCPQEREDTRTEWRAKWRWLHVQDGRHPDTVRLVEDPEVTDALGLRLGARPAPACVLGHASGNRTAALLEAVLEGGVPVAVWRRGGGTPAGGLPALLAPEAGPGAPALFGLPARVREVRRAAAGQEPGGEDQLVLLWDDPDDTIDLRSLA
ncbi:caspase family protein [Streptomyces sp. NBC_00091]|uniref:VMAP-C domain-containing protein n=1 Tax=Streptomyces sp. NBC_00091 TaxID=2975648 RepID=UPI00224F435E|nr:caspase family protein [Streptomyces sp. NBC_00091]MCX5375100.1 caspase family protein [Streptomyces sp. NBC_00091]